jgi:ABC-type sugar transport system ATPase subunit
MNFFEGRVKKQDGGFAFEHPQFHIGLPEKLIACCKESIEKDAITLGVRPQHLTLRDEHKEGMLKGEIYAIERLGKETVVIVQCEDEEKYKALVSPPFAHRMGDLIYSQPQADHVYLFDSKTGENLLEKKPM